MDFGQPEIGRVGMAQDFTTSLCLDDGFTFGNAGRGGFLEF